MVFSDDPETGLAGLHEVLETWPNTDSLAEFGVGGRAGTCSLLRPDPQPGYQDKNDARWWYDEESRVIVFDDPTAVGTAFPADPGYVLPDRTLA